MTAWDYSLREFCRNGKITTRIHWDGVQQSKWYVLPPKHLTDWNGVKRIRHLQFACIFVHQDTNIMSCMYAYLIIHAYTCKYLHIPVNSHQLILHLISVELLATSHKLRSYLLQECLFDPIRPGRRYPSEYHHHHRHSLNSVVQPFYFWIRDLVNAQTIDSGSSYYNSLCVTKNL